MKFLIPLAFLFTLGCETCPDPEPCPEPPPCPECPQCPECPECPECNEPEIECDDNGICKVCFIFDRTV